jgi:hypothetical protein
MDNADTMGRSSAMSVSWAIVVVSELVESAEARAVGIKGSTYNCELRVFDPDNAAARCD